jgi:hypothetical protein
MKAATATTVATMNAIVAAQRVRLTLPLRNLVQPPSCPR